MNEDTLRELSVKAPQQESRLDLAEKLTDINLRQFSMSEQFKAGRMSCIKKFEELHQGKVPRKFRQLFNVNFPIFQSFIDTLESDFSDSITATFKDKDPADYFKVKKIQAAWDNERVSLAPSGMWDYKVRVDRKNALLSGRGIQRYYASSDGGYESHFGSVPYAYFHCQPSGGGLLEDHLFAGEEMVLKTEHELWNGVDAGLYDEAQVQHLVGAYGNKDFAKELPESIRAKFAALGLDPNSNNYVGEPTFALNQWCSTYRGRRWYNLFDPFSKTWVRFEPLKDVYSGDYYPWTSWATHEDQNVFWTVGYSDFFYPVAEAVMTLINQELTNREKSNFNARAYDEEMFPNEQKLDEAQYRPDALVPVNTLGGTRQIAEGIYRFDTPQLQGTINLADWMHQQVGQLTGAGMLNSGAPAQKGQKAYIQLMQQAQIDKRLSYKAQSYQECYQQIGLRFIQGLKDHMPARMAVRYEGPEGYDEWDEITRIDLNLHKTPHIDIESTTAQEQNNKLKSEEKAQALQAVAGSPHVNDRTRVEYILRYVGHFDEVDVSTLLDVNSSVDREVQARAALTIRQLMDRKKPPINHAADLAFLSIIHKFLQEHETMLEKRGLAQSFSEYIAAHQDIANQNMQKRAKQMQADKQKQMTDQPPQPPPHPSAKGRMKTAAPAIPMPA